MQLNLDEGTGCLSKVGVDVVHFSMVMAMVRCPHQIKGAMHLATAAARPNGCKLCGTHRNRRGIQIN